MGKSTSFLWPWLQQLKFAQVPEGKSMQLWQVAGKHLLLLGGETSAVVPLFEIRRQTGQIPWTLERKTPVFVLHFVTSCEYHPVFQIFQSFAAFPFRFPFIFLWFTGTPTKNPRWRRRVHWLGPVGDPLGRDWSPFLEGHPREFLQKWMTKVEKWLVQSCTTMKLRLKHLFLNCDDIIDIILSSTGFATLDITSWRNWSHLRSNNSSAWSMTTMTTATTKSLGGKFAEDAWGWTGFSPSSAEL